MRKTHYEYFMQSANNTDTRMIFEAVKKYNDKGIHPVPNEIFIRAMDIDIIQKIFSTAIIDTQKVHQYYQLLFYMLYHQWADQNYFEVAPFLVDKLKNTDIDNISTYFVTCPYRSMYVEFPNNSGIIDCEGNQVNHIYLIYCQSEEPIDFRLSNYEKATINTTRYLSMLLLNDIQQGTGTYCALPLMDGKIKQGIDNSDKFYYDSEGFSIPKESVEMIFKLLLYINSTNVNIKNIIGLNYSSDLFINKKPKKIKKLMHRYNKRTSLNYKRFEVPIVPHETITNNIKNKTDSNTIIHKVRGHFKQQHYGKNREYVKTIWIMPYIRGNISFGSDNIRNYKVG